MELGGWDLYNGRGGMQSPTDRLCGPAKVPPTGVEFCAVRYPGPWVRLPFSGEVPLGGIYLGLLPRGGDHHVMSSDKKLADQTSRTSHARPNPYHPGKLDGVVRGHCETSSGPMGLCQVLFRGPCATPGGWKRKYQEA